MKVSNVQELPNKYLDIELDFCLCILHMGEQYKFTIPIDKANGLIQVEMPRENS